MHLATFIYFLLLESVFATPQFHAEPVNTRDEPKLPERPAAGTAVEWALRAAPAIPLTGLAWAANAWRQWRVDHRQTVNELASYTLAAETKSTYEVWLCYQVPMFFWSHSRASANPPKMLCPLCLLALFPRRQPPLSRARRCFPLFVFTTPHANPK
jgi:hypothetical protein